MSADQDESPIYSRSSSPNKSKTLTRTYFSSGNITLNRASDIRTRGKQHGFEKLHDKPQCVDMIDQYTSCGDNGIMEKYMREACDLEQSVLLHVWVRNQAGEYFLELRIRRKMAHTSGNWKILQGGTSFPPFLKKQEHLTGTFKKEWPSCPQSELPKATLWKRVLSSPKWRPHNTVGKAAARALFPSITTEKQFGTFIPDPTDHEDNRAANELQEMFNLQALPLLQRQACDGDFRDEARQGETRQTSCTNRERER